MDFIRSTSEKVKLWRVEHFFPPFFSRSMLIGGKFIFYKKIHYKICKCCNFNQSALTWKKTGEKSVQLVRVSLFRKYFLWNPYFSWTSSWTGSWTGSWTDKQSSHFSTAKEMSVKATFFLCKNYNKQILKWCQSARKSLH